MAVAVTFGIMACGGPPEAQPTTTLSLDQVSTRLGNVENRLAQAESKLSTSTNTELVAQINALKTDVAQLKNDLAGMEAPDLAGIQQEMENITNNIGVIGEQLDYNIADIDDLQAQIDAIEEPDLSGINAKVAALYVSVGNVFDWIEGLTIPEVDLSDIEDDIEDLQAQIGTIETDVANIKSVYAKYTDVQALEANLQEQVDAIEEPDLSELNAKVAALEVSVGNLFDWIEGLTIPDISGVADDISAIEADIDAIEADIANVKSVYAKYTDIQALESDLQAQINALKAGRIAYISKVRSTYLEFTTIASGDYYLILTLYGTNTSGIITIPDDVDVMLDIDYITERTMLLKANSGSWTANRVVEIGYGGINILAAEIRSCPR